MAIFNSQSNAPKKDQPSFAADTPASVPPREAPAVADFTPTQVTPPRAAPPEPVAKESLIAADLTIEGKIEGSGHVRIAGKFKGDVNVEGDLTIDGGARLNGGVRAKRVTVAGELEGNIESAERVELQPSAGLKWRSYLAQVSSSPHPWAARLAIEWLMGDAAGGGGYAVWYKAGFYPARTDVPDPPGAPERALLEQRLWEVDGTSLAGELQAMRDLVTPYVGHPVGGR